MIKTHANSAGIVLATVGSFLVWRFLTEINMLDKEGYLKGQATLTLADPTAKEIAKFKMACMLSKVGINMIIVGGLLQVISNYLPDNS